MAFIQFFKIFDDLLNGLHSLNCLSLAAIVSYILWWTVYVGRKGDHMATFRSALRKALIVIYIPKRTGAEYSYKVAYIKAEAFVLRIIRWWQWENL